MERRPTIAELCRGRLIPLPAEGEAARDARIAILRGNIRVMQEELGYVPHVYPQTADDVPAWIDASGRRISRIERVIEGLSKLPDDATVPSPFLD